MRCLSVDECAKLLDGRIRKSRGDDGGRFAFRQDVLIEGLKCFSAGSSPFKYNLCYLSQALIRWLPVETGRLLILSDWLEDQYHPFGALQLMRNGLGESRDWAEAPAIYAEPQPWSWDQIEPSERHQLDSQVLGMVLTTLMDTASDGWLLSEACQDAIQFLEGEILFHSKSPQRLDEARGLMARPPTVERPIIH